MAVEQPLTPAVAAAVQVLLVQLDLGYLILELDTVVRVEQGQHHQ
jgi:hypothetical protein